MKAFSLLIGAVLLSSVASMAQTYARPAELQLIPLLLPGPLLQPQTTVAAGSTFPVALYATSPNQYVNVYAYQFNLKFDPAKLQAVEVKEGADFQNTRVSDFIPGLIDNVAGTIKTSFDSLQGKTEVVSVSGRRVLALIQFKALQTGSADISVEYPVLLDQAGARVPLTFPPLTVTIRRLQLSAVCRGLRARSRQPAWISMTPVMTDMHQRRTRLAAARYFDL